MLAIELSPAVEERLDRLASRTGLSTSSYVEQEVLNHLEELEDNEIAESRLADLAEGRTSTIALEDVMREHGNLEG